MHLNALLNNTKHHEVLCTQCKNIVFVFNNNINRLLKNCITQVTKEKILTLNIRVSNKQYSRKLDFGKTTLVNTFLPLFQNTSTRAKHPKPHNFSHHLCITKPHISCIYTEIAQKQGNNQIAVKQRKIETHLTLILMNFHKDAQDLITFLNDKQLGTTS